MLLFYNDNATRGSKYFIGNTWVYRIFLYIISNTRFYGNICKFSF
jgi:hypothetical protein